MFRLPVKFYHFTRIDAINLAHLALRHNAEFVSSVEEILVDFFFVNFDQWKT